MKLVGPWISGFTRRTAITMKLLGIPFEHLDLNAYTDKEAVRRYSPMGKVPALALDNGEILIDSGGIIDMLHEMVGPEKALIPQSGAPRLKALQLIGIGTAIYPKLTALYDESLRPENYRLQSAIEGFVEQVMIGFRMLEEEAGDGWYVNDTLSQADIMAVVCYQAAAQFILPGVATAESFPRLAALSERAMKINAFASTVPHL
ncbi:glutathione S-transferase-like protein [Caballeronia udeis]|uniref:Glutathione S-transferase-like protein n=1 Tax=Caballeronia udeis TaxID=1232866 RepID=A0A158I5U4_9BURK|nr:glutathione S-transferase N-terminal domain-containing protein [Caballeronia udeis]SAL51985.1 glutathione S-transferase-like protein [Caballeronia udeis]